MTLAGQASGNWTESSSALRILMPGVRNSVGILTPDAFTQTNPPIVTTAGTISTKVNTARIGVLGGSIAFARPDIGANYIGGNRESLPVAGQETLVRPLGVFINAANGNPYENIPGQASGKGPYMSAQGTFGNALYETHVIAGAVTNFAPGTAIPYAVGQELIASRNGYLCPRTAIDSVGTLRSFDVSAIAAEVEHLNTASSTIGILKMTPDSVQNELVYDQRL